MLEDNYTIIFKDNPEGFEIPPEGCLGLLALGDVGITLWREKVKEAKAKEVAEKAEETIEKAEEPKQPDHE
jgi:hypothetical protein